MQRKINDKRKWILSINHRQHYALGCCPQQQSTPKAPPSTGPNRQESRPPIGITLGITGREREATYTQLIQQGKA
jgi:hypothetical protein